MAATSPAPIYLDHAATTPLRPEVADAMARAQAAAWANPSSSHALGRAAKRVLEDCRERILHLLGGRTVGGDRDRLVFTSGATEANRLVILGLAGAEPGTFASSHRDHPSVRGAGRELARRGWHVVEPPLDASGRTDHAWTFPRPAHGVWATTLVCGQSGSVENLAGIAARLPPGVGLHVDATQGMVTERISFPALGATTLVLAPHKFEGPRGIGAAIVRGDMPVAPLVPGTQEAGLRGGTEPVVLAVGFVTALELAVAEREATAARIAALREGFAAAFTQAAAGHGITIERVGPGPEDGGHVLTLAIRGIDRQAFVMAADLAGVCCGTGTACASGSSEPAPALAAMGLAPDVVAGAVRFSFGRTTTAADVDEAVVRLSPALARLGLAVARGGHGACR